MQFYNFSDLMFPLRENRFVATDRGLIFYRVSSAFTNYVDSAAETSVSQKIWTVLDIEI